jgi:uncharacterized repeat protein (TIGR01451 family)
MLGKWLKLRDARRKGRRNKSTSRVPRPDSRRTRAVPSLEPLEDRVVPVLFFVADAQLLSVTHSPAAAVAGAAETFVVKVRNNGPMTLHGLNLGGQVNQSLTGVTFTPSTGAFNAVTGNWTGLSLAPGATASLTVRGTLASTVRGTLDTTFNLRPFPGIFDPNPANNSFTDHVGTVGSRADLSITKTDSAPAGKAVPGTQGAYTVVVSNAGPSAVFGAAVADHLPAAITSATWTAVASGGASVAAASGTGSIATTVNLAPGATVTFTIHATIDPSATGTLANTATVSAPQGVTDPNAANNSTTDTLTLTPTADLSVTKSDDQGAGHTAAPGRPVVYTVVVSNPGPSAVTGAAVADNLPAGVTGDSWTAAASSGASVAGASGTGNIATTVNLLPGASVTFTITAATDPSATGTLANTATVSAPQGVTDPNAANNSATDTLTLTPTADLQITKTDSAPAGQAAPGTQGAYTIVVSNAGPSAVTGAAVVDNLPAAIASASWTAVASGGASVADSSGTGSIATTVNLAPGASVTFTVNVTIDPSATGTLANTATVTAPAGVTDPNLANNSATDTLTLAPVADLQIDMVDNSPNHTAIPGVQGVYTLVVGNAGPSAVTGAAVADNLPAGIASATWTAVASGGASVAAASGTGSIATTVNLAPGATVTFTIHATIDPSATGTLANTATITAPAGVTDQDTTNNSTTDTLTLTPTADLSVTKSDNQGSGHTAVPGTQVVYTVVVSNTGPSAVTGAAVADTLPAAITSASWTAAASGGASVTDSSGTGNVATTVNLLPGASVTFTITATIDPSATGTVDNTATVTAPQGATDPDTSNNSATDTMTLTPTADLQVTKTDDTSGHTAAAGATVTYTVLVTNAGVSAVRGASVTDDQPTGISSQSWTAVTSGGASVASASGTGNIATTADLPPGGSVTFTVTAVIDPSATGSVTNTANVGVPVGVTDPDLTNNSAGDTITLI